MKYNTSLQNKLSKTGLSDKEAAIYASLVQLGGAYPSVIAKHSGLNRSTTYNVLNMLAIKGLVNEIEKKNKIYYQIEKPNNLVKYSKSLITQANLSYQESERVLPLLESLLQTGDKPRITYHEGTEGMIQIYTDQIDTNKPYEMLAWTDTRDVEANLPEKFFKDYISQKVRLGITTRGISVDTPEVRTFNSRQYKNRIKKFTPDIRYADKDQFPMSGEIVVYGKNKVSIVNFNKDNIAGTIIEDQNIHNMIKTIFELSWSSPELKK